MRIALITGVCISLSWSMHLLLVHALLSGTCLLYSYLCCARGFAETGCQVKALCRDLDNNNNNNSNGTTTTTTTNNNNSNRSRHSAATFAGREGRGFNTGVCEQNTPLEKNTTQNWEDKLSECQIKSWIAVSTAALQGKGLCKRSALFTDTGNNNNSNDDKHSNIDNDNPNTDQYW